MNFRNVAATLVSIALLAGSGLSVAAETQDAPTQKSPMMSHHMMMNHHAMNGVDMNTCPMMMSHFPAGNEKLELQMQGEMMKAMGDIMLKYADRIPDAPAH